MRRNSLIFLQIAIWLGAGTLMGRLRRPKAEEFFREEAGRVHSNVAKATKDVVLLLAKGNTGAPEVLESIASALNSTQPLSTRLLAARALRKFLRTKPYRAGALLWPIFMNPAENLELRVEALRPFLESDRRFLGPVVSRLRRERSGQLVDFAVNHLRGQRSPGALWALSRLPRSLHKLRSPFFKFQLPIATWALEGYVLFEEESLVPISLTMRLQSPDFAREAVTHTEVTVRGFEIKQLMEKMVTLSASVAKSWTKAKKPNVESDVISGYQVSFFGDDVHVGSLSDLLPPLLRKGNVPSLKSLLKGLTKKWISALSFHRTIALDSSVAFATPLGMSLGLNRTAMLLMSSSLPLKSLKEKNGTTLAAEPFAQGATMLRDSVTIQAGLSRQAWAMEDWAQVLPSYKRRYRLAVTSWKTGNISMYLLRPKKKPYKTVYLVQGGRLVFKLQDGFASYKPQRSELKPENSKMENVETAGPIPMTIQTAKQWIPDDTPDWLKAEFKTDRRAGPEQNFRPVEWGLKMKIPTKLTYKELCVDINSRLEKLKRRPVSPLRKRFPRIRDVSWLNLDRNLFDRFSKKPSFEPALPMMYYPLQGARNASIVDFRAYYCFKDFNYDETSLSKANAEKKNLLTVRTNSSGAFYRIDMNSPFGSFRIDGAMGSLGKGVKYTPDKPFSIARNAKFLSVISNSVLVKGKQIPIMDSVMELSTSKQWVEFWRRALSRYRKPPTGIPDAFAKCRAAAKKKNYKSQACDDAWNFLNTFDSLKITVTEFNTSYSKKDMRSKLAQVFPFYVFSFGENFSRLALRANKNKGWILSGQLKGNDWKLLKQRKRFAKSLQLASPCLTDILKSSSNMKEALMLILSGRLATNAQCK